MKRLLRSKITLISGVGLTGAVLSTGRSAAEDHVDRDDETMTLKSVQVFFRHGARTPLSHLPNVEEVNYPKRFIHARVPYTEVPYEVYNLENGGPRPRAHLDERYKTVEFKGGVFAGALTALGKDQTYLLGRKLRRKYFQQLGLKEIYDPREVFVRATNTNRTIESLQGVLGGLFGKEAFSDPVKIPVLPLHREFMFPQTRYCQPLSVIYNRAINQEDEFESVKSIIDKINKIIGHEEYLNMMAWRDNIAARKAHGLPVPKFMLEHENEIEDAATLIVTSHSSGLESDRDEALKYTTGPMLDMVMENVTNTAEKDHRKPKLYLFSAHDTTIVPLLVAFKIFDNKWPVYCANIAIELWQKDSGDHIVKILYCDKDAIPEGMNSAEMSVTAFEKLIAPYRMSVNRWCSICHLRDPESNEEYERHPAKIDETIAPKAM